MVLVYPSTCTVDIPLSATAFYHLSQAPAFCSFVAEVRYSTKEDTVLLWSSPRNLINKCTLSALFTHLSDMPHGVAGLQPWRAAYGGYVVPVGGPLHVLQAQRASKL